MSLVGEQSSECFAGTVAIEAHALGVPVVGLFSAHGVDSGDERPNSFVLGNGLGRKQDERQTDSFGFAETDWRFALECQNARLVAGLTNRDEQRIDHPARLNGCGGADRRSGDGAAVLTVGFLKRHPEGFASARRHDQSEPSSDSFDQREVGCGTDAFDGAHLVTSAVIVVLFIPRFLMTV